MPDTELIYLQRRAQQERERALNCDSAKAARVHFDLAEEYDRRIGEMKIGQDRSRALLSARYGR